MEILTKQLTEQYFLFNTNKIILEYVLKNKIMVYTNVSNMNLEFNKDIELSLINWKYNENNFRIPYFNDEKITHYKLKENDNIIDFISSLSIVNDNDIINGEKIQSYADVVIGQPSSLQWNPNNNIYSKKLYNIDSLLSIDNFKSIFVFTHDLEIFYNKFNNYTNDKIIITHNSDHEITKKYNFKIHLCQNTFVTNNAVIPIPIGIENTQWFDNNIFHKIRKLNIQKTKFIYFYFNQNTHPTRKQCYNKLINKLEWNTPKNKSEYFVELASHKYAICPRGNGLDTHRIWECIYLNTIPIVIKSDFPNITNLPIIILNDWSELDINKLNNEFINQKLSKVTNIYYKKIIENI
jgi:hypothetical protein